jgi:hypothetical protein
MWPSPNIKGRVQCQITSLVSGIVRIIKSQTGATVALTRLDERLRLFIAFISVVTLIMGAASSVASGTISPFLAGLVALVVMIISVRYEPDTLLVLLVNSPCLTYLFSTLLFGVINGNIFLDGMFNAERAFTISLVYQIGVLFALGAAKPFAGFRNLPDAANVHHFSRLKLSLVTASAIMLLAAARGFGVGQSLISALLPLLWWSIAASSQRGLRGSTFLITALSVLSLFIVSLVANQRTYMFSGVLFIVLFYLTNSPKLFSFTRAAGIAVASIALGVVSQSFINARPNDRSQVPVSQVINDTLSGIISAKTWKNALPSLEAEDLGGSRFAQRARYYSPFLQGGPTAVEDQTGTISARFAQLGHMDIVTGQYPLQKTLDFENWHDHIWSAFAGTDNNSTANLYSDELVWRLGLRPRGSIGRPLVTVAGELYMLSGIYLMIFTTFTLYLALFLEILFLRRIIGFSTSYVIGGIIFLIPVVFTGTAFSLLGLIVRGAPAFLFMVWIAVILSRQRDKQDLATGASFDK